MKNVIIVGNIGTVYTGDVREFAEQAYREYIEQSKMDSGRASGERVTWMREQNIYREFDPKDIDPVETLRQLVQLTKQINNTQHAGNHITADVWSDLYQLTATAEMVVADMVLKGALQHN